LAEAASKEKLGEAEKKVREREDSIHSRTTQVQQLEAQLRESHGEGTLLRQSLQSTQQ
jgi:hypothetical protein